MKWQSLIPVNLAVGKGHPVAQHVARRIFRFHLVDSTRGEPPFWPPDEVNHGELRFTVRGLQGSIRTLNIRGPVLMSTETSPDQAERGHDVELAGVIRYNPRRKAIEQFDLVAVGVHWGEGPFTGGAWPGKTPLGVTFELGSSDDLTDHIPPQAARDCQAYLRVE